jgi:hypothetical protein
MYHGRIFVRLEYLRRDMRIAISRTTIQHGQVAPRCLLRCSRIHLPRCGCSLAAAVVVAERRTLRLYRVGSSPRPRSHAQQSTAPQLQHRSSAICCTASVGRIINVSGEFSFESGLHDTDLPHWLATLTTSWCLSGWTQSLSLESPQTGLPSVYHHATTSGSFLIIANSQSASILHGCFRNFCTRC